MTQIRRVQVIIVQAFALPCPAPLYYAYRDAPDGCVFHGPTRRVVCAYRDLLDGPAPAPAVLPPLHVGSTSELDYPTWDTLQGDGQPQRRQGDGQPQRMIGTGCLSGLFIAAAVCFLLGFGAIHHRQEAAEGRRAADFVKTYRQKGDIR